MILGSFQAGKKFSFGEFLHLTSGQILDAADSRGNVAPLSFRVRAAPTVVDF